MSGTNLKFVDEQPKFYGLARIGSPLGAAVSSVTAPDPPSAAKRYDEATVQKALTLALELQHEHHRTLTAEQIVSIGEEASIEPEFVRQALALIDAETKSESRLSRDEREELLRLRNSKAFLGWRALPTKAKRAAAIIPSAYAFLTILQFDNPTFGLESRNPTFILANVFVAAPLLALTSGMMLRSKRLGFVVGFFLGAGIMASAVITTNPVYGPQYGWDALFWQMLGFCSAGGAIGVAGAAIRNDGPRIFRQIASNFRRTALRPGHSFPEVDVAAPPT